MSEYIANQQELESLVERLMGSSVLAIDTEFLREKTYFAKLCLIQVNNGDIQAIIDPLTCTDLTVLAPILTDKNCVKIFHAGSQDLDIIYHECGVVPAPLFDTQTAASLLGFPLQIGYGPLVKGVCGVTLPKADSYTDWSRRPLTKDQIKYALDDVVYLPRIYDSMMAQLKRMGRVSWLDSEFAKMTDPKRYECDPDEIWHKVKRVSALSRRQLAIVRETAAWREREAMRRNLPRKWVMPDEAVVEIARKAPKTIDRLHEVRGLGSRLSTKASREILAGVKRAQELPEEKLPRIEKKPHGTTEIDGAVDLMAAIVDIRARKNDVAPQVLASRDELAALARGHRSGINVLEGWRAEMVGNELIDILEGKRVIFLQDGQINVEKRKGKSEI